MHEQATDRRRAREQYTAGVALHPPMFVGAADVHYALRGMGVDALMVAGMVLITVGMGAVVFGLTPSREQRLRRVRRAVLVSALDDRPIGRAHAGLMAILTVAIIGIGVGFLLTSALATWLIPHFGWRVMWFFGLPTGLVLIVLNRFIPESPRFLVEYGRIEEGRQIMSRARSSPTPRSSPCRAR